MAFHAKKIGVALTIVVFGVVVTWVVTKALLNDDVVNKLDDELDLNNDVLIALSDDMKYNDKTTFDNQKYIYKIYNQNNTFTESKHNRFVDQKQTQGTTDVEGSRGAIDMQQHFNMMKNYDVLDTGTK